MILSPPTSRASAARSSVVATTRSPAAAAGPPSISSMIQANRTERVNERMINSPEGSSLHSTDNSERVRDMRTDGEIELEQELVGRNAFRVVRVAVLAANLAELARPERHVRRHAVIEDAFVEEPPGSIVAAAQIPAPCELVVAAHVQAVGLPLGRARRVVPAPHCLPAAGEATIDGPA